MRGDGLKGIPAFLTSPLPTDGRRSTPGSTRNGLVAVEGIPSPRARHQKSTEPSIIYTASMEDSVTKRAWIEVGQDQGSAVSGYVRKVLERLRVLSGAGQGFKSPGYTDVDRFSDEAIGRICTIVTEYHLWRHTPRSERTKDWPKDIEGFAQKVHSTPELVREAVYQARYHRWEERFVPKVSREARVSQIKDSLLHNVLRQDDIEDPGKVNANLYRTALQAEGAIQGTQKVTQVNIGSNVVNVPEGTTKESLGARLEVLNRLAQRLGAKEVPVEREESLPQGGQEDRRLKGRSYPQGESEGRSSRRLRHQDNPLAGAHRKAKG